MTLFKSASEFSHYIEQRALLEGLTCTELLIEYCDERCIEFEHITKLINTSLKGKLQREMINQGLLPEQTQLDA